MGTLTADTIDIDGMRFTSIWLRDNCQCADCRDPGTAQKLFGITDLPDPVVVADVQRTADQVTVTFGPEGHRSVFSRRWLLDQPPDGSGSTAARAEPGKQLWTASDLKHSLPLACTPVPFAFRDKEAELHADRPIIELDARRNVRGIRFSNRHVQPLHLSFEETVDFYRAYRRFADIAYSPELQLNFKLEPGDCLIFDNTRLLHARTGFTSSGERHLQGAYADLDSLESTLRVLRRELQAI